MQHDILGSYQPGQEISIMDVEFITLKEFNWQLTDVGAMRYTQKESGEPIGYDIHSCTRATLISEGYVKLKE